MFDFGWRFAGLEKMNAEATDSCRRCNMHRALHLKMRIRGRLFLDLKSGWSRLLLRLSRSLDWTGRDLSEDLYDKSHENRNAFTNRIFFVLENDFLNICDFRAGKQQTVSVQRRFALWCAANRQKDRQRFARP